MLGRRCCAGGVDTAGRGFSAGDRHDNVKSAVSIANRRTGVIGLLSGNAVGTLSAKASGVAVLLGLARRRTLAHMRTMGGTRGQVHFEGKEGPMPEQAKTRLAELRQVNPSAKLAEESRCSFRARQLEKPYRFASSNCAFFRSHSWLGLSGSSSDADSGVCSSRSRRLSSC